MTKAANDSETDTGSKLHDAGEALRHQLEATKAAAAEAFEATRAKAGDVYETAREKVSTVKGRAASGIDASPAIALAGGLALGVIAGALVPRSAREGELLGAVGERLNGAVKAAFAAGKEAGVAKLAELGLSPDTAREQVTKLLAGAGDAAAVAGQAAVQAVRDKKDG